MRIRREFWELFTKRIRPFQTRRFCTDKKIGNSLNATGRENGSISKEVDNVNGSSSMSRHDAYKQLENLDFMTAAKILFTTPPKKKEFGLDFHLVQLFFACMPSLAVYLVAMYARSEMRRMEAEAEKKKQAEEEAKAKEMELKAAQEKENPSDPHIQEVKVRLDKLEEIVKEIVVESKTRSLVSSPVKDGEIESKQATTNEVKKKIDGKTVDGSSNTAVNSNKQVNAESSSTQSTSAPQMWKPYLLTGLINSKPRLGKAILPKMFGDLFLKRVVHCIWHWRNKRIERLTT